jgi:hypothetical protein
MPVNSAYSAHSALKTVISTLTGPDGRNPPPHPVHFARLHGNFSKFTQR